MRYPPTIDEGRRKVWVAFAEHFLDTETRHELPMAALAAIEAGFSVEEAFEIWAYEVAAVVGVNLWSVAGEWAGWDDAWLVARISEVARRRGRPHLGSMLAYRVTVHFGHASWIAIERLMRALLDAPQADRQRLAKDLSALGRSYFDFMPPKRDEKGPERKQQLQRLFAEVFLPAMLPCVVTLDGESPRVCAARVERWLGAPAS
jgi:hypothetical protein